jgi:hypothetical protein
MEIMFHDLYVIMDQFLIFFFRLSDVPIVGFLIGSFCLAFFSVIPGELTVSLAVKINKRYTDAMAAEINEKERLSMVAYGAGDKTSYKALNKDATDAWGKHFFTMAAYSAGMLWPVPFALSWLHGRFAGVDFALAWPLDRLLTPAVSYAFVFIPIYILARIVFGRLRRYLPYFKNVQRALDMTGDHAVTGPPAASGI